MVERRHRSVFRGTAQIVIVAMLLVAAPSLPAGAAPALSWKDCGVTLGESFQCATIRVPLPYEHPQGRSISISLIRHLARDPARRVGSLLLNPGGPGGSGLLFLRRGLSLIPAELQARFDLVSFDPRGVGDSTPVRCFSSMEEQQALLGDVPPFPTTTAGEGDYLRAVGDFAGRCAERNPDLLPHMATADAARDMDRIRAALGEPGLNYLGLSYGTFLGATYANLFPGRVRAVVLDGSVDPVQWTTGRDDQADRNLAVVGSVARVERAAAAVEANLAANRSRELLLELRGARERIDRFGVRAWR